MDVVLKFKDSVLKESDLDTLRCPCYLEDSMFVFYFNYLTSITESDDILFVNPLVSTSLSSFPEDINATLDPLEFGTKNLIFFAVNDPEGDHWSLLVYDRKLNEFLHHDSMEGTNSIAAIKLFEAVKDFVGKGNINPDKKKKKKKKTKNELKKSASPAASPSVISGPPSFKECPTPQQTNGVDCGLFVMAIARAICEWYCSKKKSNYWFQENQVEASVVECSMRLVILNLILDLSRKNN